MLNTFRFNFIAFEIEYYKRLKKINAEVETSKLNCMVILYYVVTFRSNIDYHRLSFCFDSD